jgi:hypothetical protein
MFQNHPSVLEEAGSQLHMYQKEVRHFKENDDFTTLTDPKILPLSTCDYHDFNFTGRSPDRYSAAHDPWFSAAFRRHEERLSVELDQEDCLKISRG